MGEDHLFDPVVIHLSAHHGADSGDHLPRRRGEEGGTHQLPLAEDHLHLALRLPLNQGTPVGHEGEAADLDLFAVEDLSLLLGQTYRGQLRLGVNDVGNEGVFDDPSVPVTVEVLHGVEPFVDGFVGEKLAAPDVTDRQEPTVDEELFVGLHEPLGIGGNARRSQVQLLGEGDPPGGGEEEIG